MSLEGRFVGLDDAGVPTFDLSTALPLAGSNSSRPRPTSAPAGAPSTTLVNARSMGVPAIKMGRCLYSSAIVIGGLSREWTGGRGASRSTALVCRSVYTAGIQIAATGIRATVPIRIASSVPIGCVHCREPILQAGSCKVCW